MKLLLIACEGADWKTLTPLLDAGEMPTLNRMVENGVSGMLSTVQPPVPAALLTSLATGKRAWQHRICVSSEIPVDAKERRSAALWEILAAQGKRCVVAGWPATHGGRVDGVKLISNRYHEPTAPPGVKPWPPAIAGTYWPEEIGPAMDKLRVSPEEIAADIVARYLADWRKIDQKHDNRIGLLRVALGADFSYQTAISQLLTGGQWDFAAVRFGALEAVRKIFGPGDAVKAHCRMFELMLRRLVEIAGKDAAVMVVSAQGRYGIFAASGPGFAPDVLLHGASVLDVAPTVLTYFGVPIGDDMEGRVLVEGFSNPLEIKRVATRDSAVVNSTLQPEACWNFAQSCIEAGRYKEALPVLVELFRAFPEHADSGHALFQCQLALGLHGDAEVTLEVLLEALPPGITSLLSRAEMAMAKREMRLARSLVDEAREAPSSHPLSLRRLGMLLYRLHDWNALGELARQTLEQDESDPILWLALAESQLRLKNADEAAESAHRAIGLKYFLIDAHFVLARALVAQGKWTEGRAAMETLLKLQPNHPSAPAYLKRLEER